MKYDVVIIGGGMTGLISSIYLSSKGLKTAVVSKGDPVCSISSGCIDVAGDFQGIPDDHPYTMAGREKVRSALMYFKEIMKDAGLPYWGEVFENRSIYTPIAKKRETCLVPFSMKNADGAKGKSLHIISFQGMKDFFPGYFKEDTSDFNCSLFDAGTLTTVGIATKFDDPAFREQFILWLKECRIQEEFIGIPAVLGTKNPQKLIDQIELVTGCKVFEIPTLPPSMPGLRLFRKLKSYSSLQGVDFFWGHGISEITEEENLVTSLIIDQPGRPTIIEGRSFILTTGSFVSGGLFAEKESIRETVFNLPVSIPPGKPRLNDSFFDTEQPLGRAGIRVSSHYQPVDSPWKNIFVAGSILENSQIMKYHCGHGLAIVTGLDAAENCEEYLK
ncbi:MAG: anaerobic glycerol-3-phosphate dehydrogenase subunit B [Spirochaetaceae bacterium]|nr:anaerobic glycerol-3-phosphate dehydrogenase subunit B [Spirochaetaceae bacterium]